MSDNLTNHQENLLDTLRQACKKIAPVWPLENFVAVNPYLGQIDKKFETVAHDLATAGGIQMTLPVSFYLQKFREGKINSDDLTSALQKHGDRVDAAEFIKKLESNPEASELTESVLSVADVATHVTNKDWKRFVISRVSTWASSYFDTGQAIWSAADQNEEMFASWKAEAAVDRTPELTGLSGFRKLIKAIPDNPLEATALALEKLGIPTEGIPIYLHRILLSVGGWSAYTARLDWDNVLNGGRDGKQIEFLAILTCWETCLLESLNNKELNKKWNDTKELLSVAQARNTLNQQLAHKLILQEAFDRTAQRNILEKFQGQESSKTKSKNSAKVQAVFCIDVRSEVYRRNLELVDDTIETLGFAGFFAFPIKYVPIGHEEGEAQCPVLLKTGPTILEEIPDKEDYQKAFNGRIMQRHFQQVWKSFKSGAVTCFSFVSPMGLSYLPKLFTDSFGLTRPVPHPTQNGISDNILKKLSVNLESREYKDETAGIPLDQQIQMAKNALTAMSLTDDFANFVLIVGHGSTMVNNPHATGYDCGACGGHTGEANARVAAAVLNNRKVRAGLQKEGIFIPVETTFLACLHDTTTDEVSIFNEQDVPSEQRGLLQGLKKSLAAAGIATRTERSFRMTNDPKSDVHKSIVMKSKDWSQVRPEWGLAGCNTFVVAPRERTKGINFEGQSFLHSYQWERDSNFSVLELIMTAPMVVTSWINLQYYGSAVDNLNMGSGNKTLHNVTAGVGVFEGFSGDLRVGLPLQSIHDGEKFQHEPLRLNVIIEAPKEAMNAILEKHKMVRYLCDNGWLYLFAMDENGKVSHRYLGDFSWEDSNATAA